MRLKQTISLAASATLLLAAVLTFDTAPVLAAPEQKLIFSGGPSGG